MFHERGESDSKITKIQIPPSLRKLSTQDFNLVHAPILPLLPDISCSVFSLVPPSHKLPFIKKKKKSQFQLPTSSSEISSLMSSSSSDQPKRRSSQTQTLITLGQQREASLTSIRCGVLDFLETWISCAHDTLIQTSAALNSMLRVILRSKWLYDELECPPFPTKEDMIKQKEKLREREERKGGGGGETSSSLNRTSFNPNRPSITLALPISLFSMRYPFIYRLLYIMNDADNGVWTNPLQLRFLFFNPILPVFFDFNNFSILFLFFL